MTLFKKRNLEKD